MRPTKYNKSITVTRPAQTENEIGGWRNDYDAPEWTFTTWASVVPLSAYKRLEFSKMGYEARFEVEFRKRLVNPDGDCRVTYDGTNYNIVSFSVDDDRVSMVIGITT